MNIRALMKNVAGAAFATALLSGASSAVTVQNGSFENVTGGVSTYNGGSWQVYTSIPEWTTTSGNGIEIQTSGTLGSFAAQDGNQYVELDGHPSGASNSTMQQMVSLGAGTYNLSFYYSPRTSTFGTNGIAFSVGPLLSAVTGATAGASVGSWTQIVEQFTVGSAGSYALSFSAFGDQDTYGGLIDNVAIAPVPLPAGVALLLTAIGGLSFLRYRQRA